MVKERERERLYKVHINLNVYLKEFTLNNEKLIYVGTVTFTMVQIDLLNTPFKSFLGRL